MSLSRSEPSRHRPAGKKLPSAPTQKPANPLGSAHAPRRPPPAGLSPRAEKQKRRPQQGGISQKIGGGSAPLRGCSQSGRQAERDFLRKGGGAECARDECYNEMKKLVTSGLTLVTSWWRRVDSNHRSETQQIYSLPPLATRELLQIELWSWWTDSNPRPADYKSAALPAELHQRIKSAVQQQVLF